MNKKTYRGVIFDLDGTLLDTSEGVFASVRHTVEALGKPALDEATLRTFIGPPVKLSLIRLYGLDEDAANHATEIFRTQYKDHDLLKAEPYAGIKDLIRALRAQGCKIGVATLKREDYALTLLEHYHFTELCDSICGSDFASKMTKADVLHKFLSVIPLPTERVPKRQLSILWQSPTASDQIPRRHGRNMSRFIRQRIRMISGRFWESIFKITNITRGQTS